MRAAAPKAAPMPTGRKDDYGKPRMELLSHLALRGTAMVLNFGAKKYKEHNWRGGIAWSRLIGATLRHLLAFMDGEDFDPESGLPHIDHIACCVMFLQEQFRTKRDLDDRWKTGDVAEPVPMAKVLNFLKRAKRNK